MNMSSYTTEACMPQQSLDELVALMKLLSDPTRLKVLHTLRSKGPHCVGDCMCHLPGVSQSLLSHHIADLREAGLVVSEKKGLKVYYSLSSRGQELMAMLTKLNKGEKDMDGCQCSGCTCQSCKC
jgi:DNA-binding transcriptional ArsR family regulator